MGGISGRQSHSDGQGTGGRQGLGAGNEELFSGWRVSFWQDENGSGIGLHENVNVVDTAELHGQQWFWSSTLCVYL